MDGLREIAAAHGVPLVEDAAQAFGAAWRGKRAGSLGAIAAFSFYPTKNLGCYGDGGALFTSDDHLAEKMRAIRTHGGVKRHHHQYLGMNGRFDTLQAAVLLGKLPHFGWEVSERFRIGLRFNELLDGLCVVPTVLPGNTHVFAQYTIRVPDRDALGEKLKAKGIPTAIHYPKCLHEQPVFDWLGYQFGQFPESEKASRSVISLPMHPFLAESDQNQLARVVRDCL